MGRCKRGIQPLNPKGYKNEDVISCELIEYNSAGHKRYHAFTKDGEAIPLRRTSSIIKSTIGNSDGLLKWYARMAASYVDQTWDVNRKRRYTEGEKQFIIANAAEYPERYKDECADLGKQAHDVIDKFFKTGAWPGPDQILDDRVVNSLELFARRWSQTGYQVLESEFYCWDVELECGGTADAIAFDPANNTYVLIDFKTGSGIYSNHLYQVAAYVGALNRMGSRGFPVTRAFVMRIGREDAFAQMEEIEAEELEEGYELFKEFCRIQRAISRLDSRYYNRKKKWESEHAAKAEQEAELTAKLERMVRESEVA